jgi:uncharacterized protein
MIHTSWLHPGLEKRCSATQGCGVFARQEIPRGERLAVFGGRIMRIDDMLDIPVEMQRYTMQIEERFVLGPATNEPEDTDFFNHSCDPNSGFKGTVFLVAMRDIRAGEEVTFDYCMTVSESVGSTMVFRMECRCGSSLCRTVITENDWKLPDLQERYREYFSQYIQEKMDLLNSQNVAVREVFVIPDEETAGVLQRGQD